MRLQHLGRPSSCFLLQSEVQFRPPDPTGPRPVGQVQRTRHKVHRQGGGVCQASARLHRPDHRRPDHPAQSCLPRHPGRSIQGINNSTAQAAIRTFHLMFI